MTTPSPGASVGTRNCWTQKGGAVDRTVENQGRVDAIMAERGQKSRRFPVTMGDLANQPFALWAASAQGRHLGCRPGFIDEDELRRIERRQVFKPDFASLLDVLALLLRRVQRFFYSSNPSDGENSRSPSGRPRSRFRANAP